MKIAFLIRSLNTGGAERQLVALANGLSKRGHHVVVITYYDGGALARHLDAGVTWISLGKKNRWDILHFFWKLVRTVRSTKPEFLYSFLMTSNVITALIRPFIDKARIIWGIRTSNINLDDYDWLTRFSWTLEKNLSFAADLLISNSQAGKDYAVRHGFPDHRTIVIANGIDTDHYRPNVVLRQAFRGRLAFDDQVIAVGIIARLDPVKGHEIFLKAAQLLADDDPSMRFVCVGPGDAAYETRLKALARHRGIGEKVFWLGEQTDMATVYNGLDVVCLASLREGFPNVLGEAMACGKPCAATDVGDCAEIISDPALLAPAGDSIALASAIANACQKRHVSTTIRSRIEMKFSLVNLIAATEVALSNLET